MSDTPFVHDLDAVLDYTWDWGQWLEDGETITAQTVTATTDRIAVREASADDSTVTAWLTATPGPTVSVRVVCHITSSKGRQDDRGIPVLVTDR